MRNYPREVDSNSYSEGIYDISKIIEHLRRLDKNDKVEDLNFDVNKVLGNLSNIKENLEEGEKEFLIKSACRSVISKIERDRDEGINYILEIIDSGSLSEKNNLVNSVKDELPIEVKNETSDDELINYLNEFCSEDGEYLI